MAQLHSQDCAAPLLYLAGYACSALYPPENLPNAIGVAFEWHSGGTAEASKGVARKLPQLRLSA
ncbi:hypothetical protein MASR1M36_07430 [Candidatus Cloacimonadaceae bacterium]